MIIQFLKYKKESTENLLKSSDLSEVEKIKIYHDYEMFIKKVLQNRNYQSFLIDSKLCKELMELVRTRKMNFVLDQSDLQITLAEDMANAMNNQYSFKNIDDFVAIHKSPVMPTNDKITTQENSGLTKNIYFQDQTTKIEHCVPYLVGNDTIHFTLNCPVSNHAVGNDWNHYPYAVMIPLKDLEKEKIKDVKTEDTFIDGDAQLSGEYFIFCPYGERKIVQEKNPNAIVIEYKDISLNDAISCMVIYSGRKLERYGSYGWNKNFDSPNDSKDLLQAEKIIKSNHYPILTNGFIRQLHSETEYMTRRMWKREYRALISLLEYNKKNEINMPDDIVDCALIYGGAYSLPGNVPVSIDLYKKYVIPILEEFGYHVNNDFFNGLDDRNANTRVIDTSSIEVTGTPRIFLPQWELELRRRVISLVKENKLIYDETKKIK